MEYPAAFSGGRSTGHSTVLWNTATNLTRSVRTFSTSRCNPNGVWYGGNVQVSHVPVAVKHSNRIMIINT